MRQTDLETWHLLEKNALKKELNILRIIQGKYQLEESSKSLQGEDYPNKYVDEELNYMKEIRKAYFLPKPEEIKEVERYEEKV